MNDDMQRWIEAGQPEPIAAECENEGRDCRYEDCDEPADYVVQWDKGDVVTFMCDDCSQKNRIWVRENELLQAEVTADYNQNRTEENDAS